MRKTSKRGAAAPPTNAAVYSGQDCIGQVVEIRGRFRALDANGKVVGRFATMREAERAVPGL